MSLLWFKKWSQGNRTKAREDFQLWPYLHLKLIHQPTLGKLAITTLELSEALPFAAFASLLLEMVARQDLVIEEV
ncbi:hypothetical protein IEQ34_003986 [Dendrobium chrysotoxum]|uniref:Uncharacterized protein n=1 Tax=Dendrobium chrysotoxum TaxID=161865 RepID=A0AAV7HGX1_DENCH|nr:hypothetical protein IEQ34_003986 [Dendrobium chrysotoxum]